MTPLGPYPAEYVRNYDGDTVTIKFRPWFGLTAEAGVRLGGIDTPEVGYRAKSDRERDLGEQAKLVMECMLTAAKEITVRVYEREKFGRLLVDLYADGKDVAAELIKSGLARPYHGGKRQGW